MIDPIRVNDVADHVTRAILSMPEWMQRLGSEIRVTCEPDRSEEKSSNQAIPEVKEKLKSSL
jgi:hypothetical protein